MKITIENILKILTITILVFINKTSIAQADFSIPDTVCVGELIQANNLTSSGNNYYWNFCSGGINSNPFGTNLGDMNGNIDNSVRIAFVKSGNDYFTFATNYSSREIIRSYYGNSPNNTPTTVNLGTFGNIIPNQTEGIKILNDNGNWYGFVVGGNGGMKLVKLEFGNSLLNTPNAVDLGNIGNMSFPHEIQIYKDNGNWYGFAANGGAASITRFEFGNSLANVPTGINLGNIGNLVKSTGIDFILENGTWYGFIVNTNSNTLTRLNFGNSLLNMPTGVNLGSPGSLFNYPFDITLIRDCDKFFGLVANNAGGSNDNIVKLEFPNGATGNIVANALPNFAGFDRTEGISEIIRVNDTLFAFTTNGGNNSISRIGFSSCSNASPASSNQFTPPPFSYNAPDTYIVSLVADEGLITQSNICKEIVVINSSINVTAQSNSPVCEGDTIRITVNTIANATYSWTGPNGFTSSLQNIEIVNANIQNSGDYVLTVSSASCGSTQTTITVNVLSPTIPQVVNVEVCTGQSYFAGGQYQTTAGTYYDTITRTTCFQVIETHLSFSNALTSNVNASICFGSQYFAGGALQSQSGIYYDTLIASGGCDSILITNLQIKDISISQSDTAICFGESLFFNDKLIKELGIYMDTLISVSNCDSIVTIFLSLSNDSICGCRYYYIPNAFTPNDNKVNDVFNVIGGCFKKFHLQIFDRWGEKIFESFDQSFGWDGTFKEKDKKPAVFVYVFNGVNTNNEIIKDKGSVTLIR
jgi:gliding motility-associated-like protein